MREYVIPCVRYDVNQHGGEKPLDYTKPILAQRKYWLRNRNYNKIILSKTPLVWDQGQHRTTDMHQNQSMAIEDTGLLLVHLKHADLKPAGVRDFGPLKTNAERWVQEGIERKEYTEIPGHIKKQL